MILAARCPYFRALFRSGMAETLQDPLAVSVSRRTFDAVLSWVYLSQLPGSSRRALALTVSI